MVSAIGNVADGKAYSNAAKVAEVKVAPSAANGRPAEQTKSDVKAVKDSVDISKLFDQNKNGAEAVKATEGGTEKEELEQAAAELSEVVQSMGANLAFSVHEATQRLVVKMVDDAGNIIREYPSSEFLDMMSRIKDYIGNLLDKKA